MNEDGTGDADDGKGGVGTWRRFPINVFIDLKVEERYVLSLVVLFRSFISTLNPTSTDQKTQK